ncbi:MAG: N-acetyl-gamma-glutamyl-phosphate reductase, partial [Bacillota bacterium]
MVNVGIVGATGYTGAELVRIFLGHPGVRLVGLTSRTYKGQPYSSVYPHLAEYVEHHCEELDLDKLVEKSDVVFTALPHGHAMAVARAVVDRGKKLIDLGADFRLTDGGVYEQWYKVPHTEREILAAAVYGLPEVNRAKIAGAQLVANPGCYPTASILALAPALKAGLVDKRSI